MKLVPSCCLVLFLVLGTTTLVLEASSGFHDRKIFASHFSGKPRTAPEVKKARDAIRVATLAALHALPPTIKARLAAEAETAAKGSYPVKTAYDFMEFWRNGNRGHYQDKLHGHRQRITTLMVGNLLDQEHNKNSTKYVDEVINGVWMLLEESTWCYPAHLSLQGTNDHLPNPTHLAIDLNAGEVAKDLAWYRLLFHEKFDHVSSVVNKRIDYELRRRIFEGYLKINFGWEGFGEGHHTVNNWNIWVNGNILKSALFTLDDVELFDQVLNRTLYSADYFLNGYGEDGGCDEGPAYWRQAGGRMIEFLESLEAIYGADARKYFASSKLMKLVGEYSYKMRITGNWFVNFADAIPMLTYPPSLLAKYGDLFGDESMKEYSAYMRQFVEKPDKASYFVELLNDVNEFMNYVNTHAVIEGYKAAVPEPELVWMPDIQVLNVRSKKEAPSQFFLGAKAGHNHESHNHNDVGNFILFQGGKPVLIDIGVGTYTAQTFNSHRYELFYMQSQYHNCPTINGIQQKEGGPYSSHGTEFKLDPAEGGAHLVSDIAGAYPKEAQVKHWIRSIAFNRTTNTMSIDDNYELTEWLAPSQLHFITVESVTVAKTAKGLHLHSADVNIEMVFDWSIWDEPKVEIKSLENDHHLTQVWGESVKRITLSTKPGAKEMKGHWSIVISAAK